MLQLSSAVSFSRQSNPLEGCSVATLAWLQKHFTVSFVDQENLSRSPGTSFGYRGNIFWIDLATDSLKIYILIVQGRITAQEG